MTVSAAATISKPSTGGCGWSWATWSSMPQDSYYDEELQQWKESEKRVFNGPVARL